MVLWAVITLFNLRRLIRGLYPKQMQSVLHSNDFSCSKEVSFDPNKLHTDEKSVGEIESTSVNSADGNDVDVYGNCNFIVMVLSVIT